MSLFQQLLLLLRGEMENEHQHVHSHSGLTLIPDSQDSGGHELEHGVGGVINHSTIAGHLLLQLPPLQIQSSSFHNSEMQPFLQQIHQFQPLQLQHADQMHPITEHIVESSVGLQGLVILSDFC